MDWKSIQALKDEHRQAARLRPIEQKLALLERLRPDARHRRGARSSGRHRGAVDPDAIGRSGGLRGLGILEYVATRGGGVDTLLFKRSLAIVLA